MVKLLEITQKVPILGRGYCYIRGIPSFLVARKQICRHFDDFLTTSGVVRDDNVVKLKF